MPLFGPPDIQTLKAKSDINGLIRASKYQKDLSIPRQAVMALGNINDPKAADALIALLVADDDKHDPYLRQLAADGLGTIGDPRGMDALLLVLDDREPELRSSAAEALHKMALKGIRDRRILNPLVSCLNDIQPNVRQHAAAALAELGWQPGHNWAGAAYYITLNQWDALIEIGEPAIEPLGKIINGGKVQYPSMQATARMNAIRVLGEIGGERSFELLFDILKVNTEMSILKDAAKEALAQMALRNEAPFISVLSDTSLSNSNYEITIQWLERNGSEQARDALTAALKHKSLYVQDWAVFALARLKDARAIPMLTAMLERGIGKAIPALGELGAVQVIPLLVNVLSQEPKEYHMAGQEDSQEQAAQVLAKFGWKPEPDEMVVQFYLLLNQLEPCLAMGASAIAPLITFLKSPVSSRAAEVLEKMGAPAVEPLCKALKADATAASGFRPASLPQGASLASEKWYWQGIKFRETVIRILGRIGDAGAVETLTWISKYDHYVVNLLEYEEIAAKDNRWPIREAAREALEIIVHP